MAWRRSMPGLQPGDIGVVGVNQAWHELPSPPPESVPGAYGFPSMPAAAGGGGG